jgi:putative ABC transport system permease protein
VAAAFGAQMGTLFPVFDVAPATTLLQFLSALAVGAVAAIAPTLRAAHINIVDGLRSVG